MIQSLYIRNYVLIDQLEMEFSGGFTTITGETGAGKSILLGALSLILGQRVDSSVLKLKDAKCIVEGTFRPGTEVKKVFEDNDLDFDSPTTLRREIAPGGKSRAFVNDTPVNLNLLKEIGNRLVDIHSQHQNLQLNDQLYQIEVVDHVAENKALLIEYQESYVSLGKVNRELEMIRIDAEKLKQELDFMQFQHNELKAANLKEGELEHLESELQRAEHAEEIRHALFETLEHLSGESTGIVPRLKESLQLLQRISKYYTASGELAGRVESMYIELKELLREVETHADRSGSDPGNLEQLRERIDLVYGLMQKHRVRDTDELIGIREELSGKLQLLDLSDERLGELEKRRTVLEERLGQQAGVLHARRAESAVEMQGKVESQLKQLGIPNARFRIVVERTEDFGTYGTDRVKFLFSANKQHPMEEISRVASGGEVSRLMLCIKSLLSDRKGMPTLIFDEIDAGVSGEIADKVGGIMDMLASGRQVVAITHLPQVASRGSNHFTVYKEDTENATFTRIRKLSGEERITEIARMLSGEKVTEAALSNARVLLRV